MNSSLYGSVDLWYTVFKRERQMKINKQNKKCRLWAVPVLCILVFAVCFLIYTGHYYHADASCKAALKSDESVSVTQTGYGWLFDGPSESDALIFYPGGKV